MNQPSIVSIIPSGADSQPASLYSNPVQSPPLARPTNREVDRLKEELRRTRQAADNLAMAYHRLLEVSRSVTELREPEEMFRRVLDAAVNVTGAERGFLFLLPPGVETKIEELTVAAAYQIRLEEITHGHFQVSRSAISRCLKEALPVRIGSGADSSQSMSEFGLRAILCEPLKIEEQVLGILYLDTTQKCSFSESHAELLRSFGAQAAVCLANVRLMQAREEASRRQHVEEAQRDSLTAFLTVASRELRDPVTVLTTGIRLLKNDRVSQENKRMVVDDLERSIHKAARMLHSYDTLREFQDGRGLQLYKQEVPVLALLNERVEEVFQLFGLELKQRYNIRIEAPADITVEADRVKLSQVLDCLLQNAISHTPSGGKLHLWFDHQESGPVICLEDDGVTIDFEQIQAIQEGRPRMNTGLSKRGEQLGLFVAANLVKAHGGTMEVGSGEATRFTVRLPRE